MQDTPTEAPKPEAAPDTNVVGVAAIEQINSDFDPTWLQSMGLTKKGAMRILANGKANKYLQTKVTARVLMVDHVNGIEQIMLAQKFANRCAKNPEFQPAVRVASLGVVAQCGMALARLSEVSLATARAVDDPEETNPAPVSRPVQNNFFGFPPVATIAKLGEQPVTDITAKTKSS